MDVIITAHVFTMYYSGKIQNRPLLEQQQEKMGLCSRI